ncbi:pilus assembly protein TadG-related protein [Anoxynatronum sibiricum]|uniref:Pilus assembly protein TadG-related protein n=1 Tax=Anoxynatronum sibiricum TaxID=210623 RepID=A0ABU9VUZ8_9CLOT
MKEKSMTGGTPLHTQLNLKRRMKNQMKTRMKRWMTGLLKQEQGSVLVLFAVFLMAAFGFSALVIDLGALRLEKSRLVNAVDAAALAGARELPQTTVAEAIAKSYAAYNDVEASAVTVTFGEQSRQITVTATRDRSFVFGPVIGVSSGTVTASATAQYGAVSGGRGIVPFGIPEQELTYNTLYTLKAGSKDDYGPGNYGALALGLPGAASYENNIKYGYNGIIRVGDEIPTEPGNMSGPTTTGVNYRINQCQHSPACTHENYKPNCSRVMIVPIYDPQTLQGRTTVIVVGFAAFFAQEVEGSGNKNNVKGYFLERVPPEGMEYETDLNQDYYGLAAARLIQ